MVSKTTLENLTYLAKNGSNGWITADLKIKPFSTIGRFFWPIAAHFEWIQKIFYNLNLAESKRKLESIKAEILSKTHHSNSIREIFDKACSHYNRNVPNKFKVHTINSREQNKTTRHQKRKNPFPIKDKPQAASTSSLKTQTLINSHTPIQKNNQLQSEKNSRIYDTAGKISILTYNVLFPQMPGKHESPFSTEIGYSQDINGNIYENSAFRQEIALKNILNSKNDINCLQEVSKDFFDKLSVALEKEGYKGEWRYHNRRHGVAIFYKQDKFQKLHSFQGHFAVQKVDQNGKKLTFPDGKPDLNKRVHLVVDLKHKTSQKVLRIASCHFHDPSILEGTKTGHVDAVMQSLNEKSDYLLDKIVVAGDFNQDQWGDKENLQITPDLRHASALQSLFKEGFLVDDDLSPSEYKRSDPKDFNSSLIPKDRKIDHIFVKSLDGNLVQPVSVPFDRFDPRASDHRAVITCI